MIKLSKLSITSSVILQLKTKRKTSRRTRTKLLFPAYRVRQFLYDGYYTNRIGQTVPDALAAIIQYLITEILSLSGQMAMKFKSHQIQPHHIVLFIRLNDQLYKLLTHVIFAQGAVVPTIPKR